MACIALTAGVVPGGNVKLPSITDTTAISHEVIVEGIASCGIIILIPCSSQDKIRSSFPSFECV